MAPSRINAGALGDW